MTAVIPSIPPRAAMLSRAVASVLAQGRPVDALSIAVDRTHAGSTATRNEALAAVRTEWCAFLDDDDEWLPNHVETLLDAAESSGADVVYPWFYVPRGWDPWPGVEGRPFDRGELMAEGNYVPVTVLARTELVRGVGGFEAIGPEHDACDDWGLWKKLLSTGATFLHVPVRTWVWHWHGRNTSGRGHRWSDGDDYSPAALADRRRQHRVRVCGQGCADGHTRDVACQQPAPQGLTLPAGALGG